MRRYPRIDGPAVLPLFCLAPHGVFRAAQITSRAVSSYLAFSPLPALFSKNRRSFFCDTFRRRNFSTATPACFTRHAAVWCSDFPPVSLTTHQRSSAIGDYFSIVQTEGKTSARDRELNQFVLELSTPVIVSNQWARKNFFSPGRKCFAVPMIGRSVVIICRHTTTKIRAHNFKWCRPEPLNN